MLLNLGSRQRGLSVANKGELRKFTGLVGFLVKRVDHVEDDDGNSSDACD